MAGAGIFTLVQVFPFTPGANVGTTITELLAATAVDGAYQFFALQIALVHVFYNAIGVALFFLVPWLRVLPLKSAQIRADSTERTRWVVPAHSLGVFAVLPRLVLGGQSMLAAAAPRCSRRRPTTFTRRRLPTPTSPNSPSNE